MPVTAFPLAVWCEAGVYEERHPEEDEHNVRIPFYQHYRFGLFIRLAALNGRSAGVQSF